jgi:hypothetical protein
MGENRKVLCIDILTYMSVITGFDVNTLTDDEIILMLENLQKLSDNNLLLLHKDLNTIFEESCIKEE